MSISIPIDASYFDHLPTEMSQQILGLAIQHTETGLISIETMSSVALTAKRFNREVTDPRLLSDKAKRTQFIANNIVAGRYEQKIALNDHGRKLSIDQSQRSIAQYIKGSEQNPKAFYAFYNSGITPYKAFESQPDGSIKEIGLTAAHRKEVEANNSLAKFNKVNGEAKTFTSETITYSPNAYQFTHTVKEANSNELFSYEARPNHFRGVAFLNGYDVYLKDGKVYGVLQDSAHQNLKKAIAGEKIQTITLPLHLLNPKAIGASADGETLYVKDIDGLKVFHFGAKNVKTHTVSVHAQRVHKLGLFVFEVLKTAGKMAVCELKLKLLSILPSAGVTGIIAGTCLLLVPMPILPAALITLAVIISTFIIGFTFTTFAHVSYGLLIEGPKKAYRQIYAN